MFETLIRDPRQVKRLERVEKQRFAARLALLAIVPSVEKRKAWFKALVGFLWRAVLGLGEGPRMVRHVGPGLRPLERHEFENPAHRDARQFGGGSF